MFDSRRLYAPFPAAGPAALFILRLIAGSAMMLHGWPKIQKPTTWMGDAMPGALQALAAVAEFGGGIAWILGLLTPAASLGLLGVMTVAVTMVHFPKGDPFVAPGKSSWELAALYWGLALYLLLAGPGRFSLDYLIFQRRAAAPAADGAAENL